MDKFILPNSVTIICNVSYFAGIPAVPRKRWSNQSRAGVPRCKNSPHLGRAIAATFERRRTPISTNTPLALTSEFTEDETKQRQWLAFVRKGKLNEEGLALIQIGAILQDFLMPPTMAIRPRRRYANGEGVEFVGGASLQENRVWSSARGWHSQWWKWGFERQIRSS